MAAGVSSLPPGARLALWSLATGELLQHSPIPPLRMMFGAQLPNVSGMLVYPPPEGLCAWHPGMAAWRGRIVLADDWTSPGCSVEKRLVRTGSDPGLLSTQARAVSRARINM